MTSDGLLKVGIVAAQAFGLIWIAQRNGPSWEAPSGWSGAFDLGAGLPRIAQLSFAIGALTLLTLVFSRRAKVEQGLLWALVAMLLGLNQLAGPEAPPRTRSSSTQVQPASSSSSPSWNTGMTSPTVTS